MQELKDVLAEHGGLYTVDDILHAISGGHMQSFAEGDTWVITQVNEYPQKTVLEIVVVVGTLDDLHAVEPRLMAYKEEIGADLVRATGRMGWLRRKFDGWSALSVNFIRG